MGAGSGAGVSFWLWAWPEVFIADVWHQRGVCGKVFCFQLSFSLLSISTFCEVLLGMFFPSSFPKDSWGVFCSAVSTILIQPEVFSEISWNCLSAGMPSAARTWIWNTVCHLLPPSCWDQALSFSLHETLTSLSFPSLRKITPQESSKLWALIPAPPLSLLCSSLASSSSSALLYSKWPLQLLSWCNCRGT